MEKNHPNENSELDTEYEKIKKLTPGLEDNQEEEQAKADALKAEADEKSKADEEAKVKADAEALEAKEAKEKQDLLDSEEENEDEDIKPSDKKTRPEKYIPVKQYTDEKRKYKETIEEKDRRIADLEKIANTTSPDSRLSDEKIGKYAEKHGLDIEDARIELERMRDAQDFFAPEKTADKTAKLTEQQKETLAQAEEIKAEKLFNDEFETVALPDLKSLFPDATVEQIKRAKAEIQKLACTKQYLDKTLDYVIFKSKSELEKVFKKSVAGPEGTRPSQKDSGELSAKDFKGKTTFEKLDDLSDSERNKIIEDMPLDTYEAYSRYNDRNSKLVINRGGKKVEF